MATNSGKGKVFWGAVIALVLIALATAYVAVVGGNSSVIAKQGDHVVAVESDVKEIQNTPKEDTKEAAFHGIATEAATRAVDEHQKSSYHRKGKPRVVQHVRQPVVVDQPQVVAVEQPKLVLPKVGDPCPYGVVSVKVSSDGTQQFLCVPGYDFYDRVEFVPQRHLTKPVHAPEARVR